MSSEGQRCCRWGERRVCAVGSGRNFHHAWIQARKMLLILLGVLVIATRGASAQQAYGDVSGYVCNGQLKSCNTYALYRTQSFQETLNSVGDLFDTNASFVAKLSGLDLTSNDLPFQQPLYVPLSCGCTNGSSQANVSHVIVNGDTFWAIANTTGYEGMTTYQAIELANPAAVVLDLQIGDVVTIPLRCACPTAQQLRNRGSQFLLTYVVYPGETLETISTYFNVSSADLQTANSLQGVALDAYTTLLIPLASLPNISTIKFLTPSVAAQRVNSGGGSKKTLYIGIAVGVLGFLAAAFFMALLLVRHRRNSLQIKHFGNEHEFIPALKKAAGEKGLSGELLAEMSDVVGSDKPLYFTYKELQEATDDFSTSSRIQGSVYLGKLNGMLVAIKKMKGNMKQELKILAQVHHGNLVKLVGMCVDGSENLYLVYEYAENGSLSDCLHNESLYQKKGLARSIAFLPWTTRVQIALDVASGLDYIHNYTNPSFVHKDVNSSNILLDKDFRAKVANFGMAKYAESSCQAGPMMTKHIVGTHGYMAPEYREHGLVTTKADVFAFGVVLLEILSGQDALVKPAEREMTQGKETQALSDVIQKVLEGDDQLTKLQAWMDPLLQHAYPLDTACSVASLAKVCVDADPAVRPTMKDINFALSKMLSASLEWESSAVFTKTMADVSVEAR